MSDDRLTRAWSLITPVLVGFITSVFLLRASQAFFWRWIGLDDLSIEKLELFGKLLEWVGYPIAALAGGTAVALFHRSRHFVVILASIATAPVWLLPLSNEFSFPSAARALIYWLLACVPSFVRRRSERATL